MMTDDIQLVQLPTRPAAVVRGQVTADAIAGFLGAAFGEVLAALAAQGAAPTGPPFGRYVPAGDGFEVTAGFPASRAISGAGRVEPCELPGGPTAQVLHRGDYSGVGAAYDAVTRWAASHGYVVAAPPWESYLDGPEVAEPRTVVSLPLRPA